MPNKVGQSFKAKWIWAQERFGHVDLPKHDQETIITELDRLEDVNLKLKKLILKERKERDG